MEDLKDILYDDVEQKFIELQDKKKRRGKRWKKFKITTIMLVLIIGSAYFLSDYSKVKSLSVEGNIYYNDSEIFEKASLSYNTRYIVMPKFLIQWNLEKDPLIESASVEKTMLGAIHITLKEKRIIGYYIADDGKNILVYGKEEVLKEEISSQHINKITKFPLLVNFPDEQLLNLLNAFQIKNREVKDGIISMISEISPYATSYDEHMVKIVMQDGNTIYSSYAGIPLLNEYKKVLQQLNESNVCLQVEDQNAVIIKTKCL